MLTKLCRVDKCQFGPGLGSGMKHPHTQTGAWEQQPQSHRRRRILR